MITPYDTAVDQFKAYTGKVPRTDVMTTLYRRYRDSEDKFGSFMNYIRTVKWLNGAC